MQSKKSTIRRSVKPLIVVGALLVVFVAGVGVGNGSVRLNMPGFRASTQNKNLPANLSYQEVEEVYDLLRERYDGKLEKGKLIDGLKAGLVRAAGDPYTVYFDPEDAKEFNEQLSGSFTGIGAQLGLNDAKEVEVVAPIDGTPAQKSGLLSKDVIAAVDGESTSGWSIDEAVSKIRGEKGTKVTLTIIRNNEAMEFAIIRDEITIPSVEHRVLDNNVGYMRVTQFNEDVAALAQEAAEDLRSKNVKGIILDLRDNPGGLVSSAVDLSSLWLQNGKLVLQEKRGNETVNTYYANGTATLAGVRTVVLINSGSASASEIVAGALKDNGAATLLGEKSYGKGSVQEIRELADGSELKVTIARWYRPNGQNIDKKGIAPDKKTEVSAEDYKQGKDPQLEAAQGMF